jgi:5'-nucleotidase
LEAFGPKPDVVISGPNLGLNTGRSVLHSGTVGAALAAQNFGMKGLAVSLAVSDPWHFDTACKYTLKVIHQVVEGPPRCVLNLNVPALPFDETKGLKWGGLAAFGSVRSQIIQQDNNALSFDLVETEYQPPEDSDLGLVNAGFAAITSLQSNAEVWNEGVQPGLAFSEAQPLPSASTNAAVTAPSHYRA